MIIPSSDVEGKQKAVFTDGTLAGKTLEELRAQYRYYLFEDFLPFHDRYVIDHEHGGFMCNTDRDGTHISTNKSAWYEGRGSWTYSFLYNNIDNNPKHLETARKSVEFILRHKPSGDDMWPRSYTRDGKAIDKPESHVYGDCFVAAGIAEYAKAVGDDTYWNLAKDILLKCVRIYDRDDYCPNPAGGMLGPDIPPLTGARMLSEWMVFLWVAMPLLDYKSDPDVEEIVSRCFEAVLDCHYNPQFDLVNEYLNHDLSHTGNAYDQYVPPATVMETLWMILNEAVRRKDKTIFQKTTERYKRHMEVGWDDVYDGVFMNCYHVDNNIWDSDRKGLWGQVEPLNGLQLIVEHSGDEWAKDWFSKAHSYVLEKWPCEQYGFPLWLDYTDRKVTFETHTNRAELYHYPRFLMLNLLSTERIMQRGGNVSDIFA
ncbi:AGE family epimerase/isomerase [Candidatus Latescibacterota bacterium]